MTDGLDPHKLKALELANVGGGSHTEVVERAKAYHEFLTSTAAAPKANTPAAAPKSTGAPAASGSKPATTAKATPAAGTKPTATAKPGAATPKATTAAAKPATPGAQQPAPKGDTKDPKGNNTYDDVVAALQKVMRSVPGDNDKRDKGRKLAYDTLAAAGGGVKGVRDLKPALYDAVVAACDKAAKAAAGKPKAAPAAPPPGDFEDEEAPADGTTGDETGDPVEETGGGLPAEDGQGTVMEGEDV